MKYLHSFGDKKEDQGGFEAVWAARNDTIEGLNIIPCTVTRHDFTPDKNIYYYINLLLINT